MIRVKMISNRNTFGVILFCLYVITTYLAQGVILPASINSFFLYLFLFWSMYVCICSRRVSINKMIIWMLCFLVYGLITLLFTPQMSSAFGQYYYLIVCFITILLLSQLKINPNSLCIINWTYSLSAPLLTTILILTGKITDTTGRLGAEVFGNANILAALLMVGTMNSIFILVYYSYKIWIKILLVAFILLDYYAMFLSGGRKFIVVPIVFFYVLLMFKTSGNNRKHIIKYTVIVAIIVVVLYKIIMNVPIFYETIGVRMEGLLSVFSKTQKIDASTDVRRSLIKMGMEKWLSSPIWGYGFDSFKYYNQTTFLGYFYSHNNFVELLFNTGLIGFSIYYYFYYFIISNAIKNKQMPTYARAYSVSTVVSILVFEYGAVDYASLPIYVMLFIAFTVQHFTPKQINGE